MQLLKDPSQIYSPQLVYFEEVIDDNIAKVVALAKDPAILWPHVKTYKCKEVVEKLLSKGVNKFKCATVAECEMVASCTPTPSQIILAYPLVGPNIQRFLKLINAFPNTKFICLLEDLEQAEALSKQAEHDVNVFIDVNPGLDRTGVAMDKLYDFAVQVNNLPHLQVNGLHCYDGQDSDAKREIRQHRIDKVAAKILPIREQLQNTFKHEVIIVAGGTPEFPCWLKYDVFCSPGTAFIQDCGYYNAFRDMSDIEPGAAVLTRVISNPTANTFTLDCGYKAIAADPKGLRGQIVGLADKVEELFQNEEHWVFKMKTGFEDELPKVGTVLYVIPTHICPTSALYAEAVVAKNGDVVGSYAILARSRKITI